MIARRTLLAAAPAAALAFPALAQSRDVRVRGSKAYSESAMVMSVAADGSSALTLRFCRFPDEDQTWLWCHILHEGQLYAFTTHDLPCAKDRLADGPAATYSAAPVQASLTRTGRGKDLADVRLKVALPFHRSRAAPHGPGDTPGHFEAQFFPVSPLAATVLEGRDEVYGLCRAEIEIGRRVLVHEGLAKFHEQRQSAPRFEVPFCYGWLAGDAINCTSLLGAKGASGGWQRDGFEDAIADLTIAPPGAQRRARWRLKSGADLAARLTALARYEIPVYDRRWQGSFVRGRLGKETIVGVVNDWRGEPDIYAASATRSQKS